MNFSKLMASMPPNQIAQLEQRRREIVAAGGEVINLSAGTPDLSPDTHVMQVLSQAAMDPESYKYAISDSQELLEAAAGWYRRRFNVALEPQQVTSLYGSQEGMAHITFPICDPGDVVLITDPSYPVFGFGPKMAGAEVVAIPTTKENGFLIDFDTIDPALADKAKMIIVSYPNNPTSATANQEFYERLVHFAKKHEIVVVHDNAYCELVLDGEPGRSFLEMKGAMDVGIEMNSLSKSYNLTGMRMSFAMGNQQIIQHLRKLRSEIDYGPFRAIQKAAIATLEGPQDIVERNRAEYRRRRDAFCSGLCKIGWQVEGNKSTMFTWFSLPNGRTDDVAFVYELLEKTGVIAIPGSSFGEGGKGFIRFALIQPVEVMTRVVEKIEKSGILR